MVVSGLPNFIDFESSIFYYLFYYFESFSDFRGGGSSGCLMNTGFRSFEAFLFQISTSL